MNTSEPRSTIGLRKSTKAKLDKCRAPGQCYDGILCQLVDMWADINSGEGNGYRRIAYSPAENK
jgi:hypothetical protein